MKKLYYALPLCGLLLLPGCIPPKRQINHPDMQPPHEMDGKAGNHKQVDENTGKVIFEREMPHSSFVPPLAYMDKRISAYGRKLEKWQELDEKGSVMGVSQEEAEKMIQCFKELQVILADYSSLREAAMQPGNNSDYGSIGEDKFMTVQKKDIDFLESDCGKKLGMVEDPDKWQKQKVDISRLEELIGRYSAGGEYDKVVQVWLKIPEGQAVSLKSRIAYGNALMYLHQEEKAAEIYQQIVDDMSAPQAESVDIVSLRKSLADLYTAAGNYRKAEEQYKLIAGDYESLGSAKEWAKLQLFILGNGGYGSPELADYSSLLRNYLGFIPKQDGYKVVRQADKFLADYPYTAVSANVDIIRLDAVKRADSWFNGLMSETDRLAGEKKYEDALKLLENIPDDIIDAEKKQALKAKIDSLVMDESVNLETEKLTRMKDLQKQWNSGILLMESGDYEKAIGVFVGLLDTEYSTKASDKIEEVSLLAAKAERRKAANIFNRFTKTSDPASKQALLIECRKVLKGILTKYPNAAITDKVVGNLKRVEMEIDRLDPTLLDKLKSEEAEKNAQPDDMDDIMAPPIQQDIFDVY
ncbi:MAG: hypothetical protein CSB24_03555 [Deltaproteobacteria bacterium]|nr:MAG: hypothetical protein CSB24_03555 [Deltaproteobacteria bacterium]